MTRPTLAIGPANYAGQAHAWARAVDRNLEADAWSFSHYPLKAGGFQFDADKMMGRYSYRNPLLRGARSRWFFRGTTHVALDGFKSFYHLRHRGKFEKDVADLAGMGRKVALIAHGTDTRSPEAHMARLAHSYFREGDDAWRAAVSASSAQGRAFAEASGLPVFYSTPDLGHDLPFGTWLPISIDVDTWSYEGPLLERERPRVLHQPSRRNPPIKGSQYVEPVLNELDAAGFIEYVNPGGVPHREMVALVKSVDIVVDQVLFGSYGVAAIEAMAAGRAVVGGLSDIAGLGVELPELVDVTPDTIRQGLLQVLEDRDRWRETAVRNKDFVRRWHDGRASAAALAPFLGLSEGGPA